MSKAFARLGLQVLAIDSVKVSGVSSVVLDLVKPLSQKLVFDLIRSRRLAAVHLAPPCGTSSAARRIDAGPGSPQPLRSALHPDGLPGLSFFNRQRVATANKLYRFSAEVILACQANGVLWSLENPESSLFWLTSPMLSVWKELRRHIFFGTFDSCVYGGAHARKPRPSGRTASLFQTFPYGVTPAWGMCICHGAGMLQAQVGPPQKKQPIPPYSADTGHPWLLKPSRVRAALQTSAFLRVHSGTQQPKGPP